MMAKVDAPRVIALRSWPGDLACVPTLPSGLTATRNALAVSRHNWNHSVTGGHGTEGWGDSWDEGKGGVTWSI